MAGAPVLYSVCNNGDKPCQSSWRVWIYISCAGVKSHDRCFLFKALFSDRFSSSSGQLIVYRLV